jgi:hypothetical protein
MYRMVYIIIILIYLCLSSLHFNLQFMVEMHFFVSKSSPLEQYHAVLNPINITLKVYD